MIEMRCGESDLGDAPNGMLHVHVSELSRFPCHAK